MLDAASLQVADTLAQASPQNISNFLWSLAQLEHTPPTHVLRACADTCKSLTADPAFNPQACSNVVWAMATIPHAWDQLHGVLLYYTTIFHDTRVPSDTQLLDVLAARSLASMQSFKPQNIANALWGFAKLGYNPGAAFMDVAGTLCTGLERHAHSHKT